MQKSLLFFFQAIAIIISTTLYCSSVVIMIDNPNQAKRIAFESTRNLSLVGYTAKPKEVHIRVETNDAAMEKVARETLQRDIISVAKAYPFDFFDFSPPCSCPDSGVFRENCQRYVICI